LVEWVLERVPNLPFIQKAVTRKLRPGECPGREVVLFDKETFHRRVKDGCIVVPYEKYGEWYGVGASSWEGILEAGGGKTLVLGIDVLESSCAMTVGDAYEAPRALRQIWADTVVIILHASYRTIVERIFTKNISREQREVRLSAIGEEFRKGFPENIERSDYLLSTERGLDTVGREVLSIIEKEGREQRQAS